MILSTEAISKVFDFCKSLNPLGFSPFIGCRSASATAYCRVLPFHDTRVPAKPRTVRKVK